MNSPQALAAFGKKLRVAREKQKLTQADVSIKSGINTNYYACIERGEVNPSFEKIQSIAKTLGLKSSEILPF